MICDTIATKQAEKNLIPSIPLTQDRASCSSPSGDPASDHNSPLLAGSRLQSASMRQMSNANSAVGSAKMGEDSAEGGTGKIVKRKAEIIEGRASF